MWINFYNCHRCGYDWIEEHEGKPVLECALCRAHYLTPVSSVESAKPSEDVTKMKEKKLLKKPLTKLKGKPMREVSDLVVLRTAEEALDYLRDVPNRKEVVTRQYNTAINILEKSIEVLRDEIADLEDKTDNDQNQGVHFT